MGEREHTVKLSDAEIEYLSKADFLTQAQREQFSGDAGGGATLTLDLNAAEQFRDAFSEQLARVGFDENYEPTAEGTMLEELIDRFHCADEGRA